MHLHHKQEQAVWQVQLKQAARTGYHSGQPHLLQDIFLNYQLYLPVVLVTGPLPGGDAGANTEALSSVARTLNFRLTVRDNAPYSSTAPVRLAKPILRIW